MRRPNFFIIGAPKSGTTALSEYLRTHPNIFMCGNKEPNFFNDDHKPLARVNNLDEYLRLFANAAEAHTAIGEGSVLYLYSSVALTNIKAFCPDAKLIALFRNPVELAYSMHTQVQFGQHEDEPDFEKAWRLQDARKRGEHIPNNCLAPCLLFYRDRCSLGEQLERALTIFPREQIRYYFFDDFVGDTRTVYEDVLTFLGVPSDGRTSFPAHNESKRFRYGGLARFVQRPPRIWKLTSGLLHQTLGIEKFGVMDRLQRMNSVSTKRAPISPELRDELIDEFRDDIGLLAKLTGRDLSHWTAPSRDEARAANG